MALFPFQNVGTLNAPANTLNAFNSIENLQNTRSRNELMQLSIQNEPIRQQQIAAQEQRAADLAGRQLNEHEHTIMVRKNREFLSAYQIGGFDAASQVISSFPDTGKFPQMKADYFAALQTPGTEDEEKIIQGAQAFFAANNEQGAAQETFRAATSDELAGLGPNVIGAQVSNTTGKMTNVQKADGSGEGGRQRDDEIRAATDILVRGGMQPQQAHDRAVIAVDNNEVLSVTPDGRLLTTDKLTGRTFEGDIEKTRPARTSVQTPQEQTLFGAAPEATGFWNAAVRRIANIGAQIGFDPSFAEEEIKAKQIQDSSLRNLKQGYSLSPKYPVAEQQMIVDEAGIVTSLWEDPKNQQARMIPLEGVLARNIAQAEIDARDSSDAEVRRDASRVARHMRSYMNVMGIPANKREDLRSWAQAQEGFFDMSLEDQERFIQKTAQQALIGQ